MITFTKIKALFPKTLNTVRPEPVEGRSTFCFKKSKPNGKPHIKKAGLIAAVLAVLTGCVPLPEAGKRAALMDIPPLAENVADTLAGKTAAAGLVQAWPEAQWWRTFGNPELERLIQTALQDNPGLKAAQARIAQAAASADFQAAEMLPSIYGNAELNFRRFSSTDFYGPNGGRSFSGAYLDPAVLHYHLDLWGRDKAALEAALGRERAQASEWAMVRLLLSTVIAREYVRLQAAEEDSELAEALTEKAEALLDLQRLRWQDGLAGMDPVHAAEQALESARQLQTNIHQQTKLLRNRLAALAGKGPDWGLQIKAAALHIEARLPEPKTLALGLLARRPDVQAALERAEASAQLIKVAQTRFYPDVNLTGFAGLRSLSFEDLFLSHGASLAYSLSPTISLPIFEGGRLQAGLKHQQAEYDIAAETYNQTLLGAVQQVADSVSEWRRTQQRLSAQERAIDAATAAQVLAAKRYQAGLSIRDAELEAESALLRQQLAGSEMHSAHLLATIGLIEALGGGYTQAAPLEQTVKQPS